MNVLLWSPKGAGLHYGGPGRAAYTLYSTLSERGVAASLAHGWHEQPPDDPVFRATHRVAALTSSKAAQARFLAAGRRWLKRHHGDYDLFHGIGGYHITVSPAAYASSLGIPAVVKLAMHRGELIRRPGPAGLLGFGPLRRRMLAKLAAVIAISTEIADELLEYGVPHQKIARIPNGVDTRRFRPVGAAARRERRAGLGLRDVPTVLFVGALTPRKRPHALLEAAAKAQATGIELQVVLVGPCADPDYRESLGRLADERGLGSHIRFVGFVEDPVPYLEAADMFVLPSTQEGLPNALAEAMAAGLAAVATPASGVGDLIEDGHDGFVVRTDDALADVMADVLTSDAVRDRVGHNARVKIERSFSVDAVAAAHLELFGSVVG